VTFAHIGGVPVEETLTAAGPALLTALGAFGARIHALRTRRRSTARSRVSSDRDEPDVVR
jgi:hypothetical protein